MKIFPQGQVNAVPGGYPFLRIGIEMFRAAININVIRRTSFKKREKKEDESNKKLHIFSLKKKLVPDK